MMIAPKRFGRLVHALGLTGVVITATCRSADGPRDLIDSVGGGGGGGGPIDTVVSAGLEIVTFPYCMSLFAGVSAYRNTGGTWILGTGSYINATERFELLNGGNLYRLTRDDIRDIKCQPAYNAALPTFTVAIQNIPSGQIAGIQAGLFTAGFGTYTLTPWFSPFDLVSYSAGTGTTTVIVRRNLSPAPGSVLPPVDYAGAEVVAPSMMSVGIDNAAAGEIRTISQTLYTPNGTRSSLPKGVNTAGTTVELTRLPPSLSSPADVHRIFVAYGPSTSSLTRHVVGWVAPDSQATLTLSPLPAPLQPTKMTLGEGKVTYSAYAPVDSVYTGYVKAEYVSAVCSDFRCPRQTVAVYVSARYRQAAGDSTWNLAFPDLSSLGVAMLQDSGIKTFQLTVSNRSFATWISADWLARPAGTVERTTYMSGNLP